MNNMIKGTTIANIGITVILLYCVIQILQFYGVGSNIYGSYVAFYIFLFLSTFILPTQYSDTI
jgi:hypothetical protein